MVLEQVEPSGGGSVVDASIVGGKSTEGGGPHFRGMLDRADLTGLVLGCIEAKFCKKICV